MSSMMANTTITRQSPGFQLTRVPSEADSRFPFCVHGDTEETKGESDLHKAAYHYSTGDCQLLAMHDDYNRLLELIRTHLAVPGLLTSPSVFSFAIPVKFMLCVCDIIDESRRELYPDIVTAKAVAKSGSSRPGKDGVKRDLKEFCTQQPASLSTGLPQRSVASLCAPSRSPDTRLSATNGLALSDDECTILPMVLAVLREWRLLYPPGAKFKEEMQEVLALELANLAHRPRIQTKKPSPRRSLLGVREPLETLTGATTFKMSQSANEDTNGRISRSASSVGSSSVSSVSAVSNVSMGSSHRSRCGACRKRYQQQEAGGSTKLTRTLSAFSKSSPSKSHCMRRVQASPGKESMSVSTPDLISKAATSPSATLHDSIKRSKVLRPLIGSSGTLGLSTTREDAHVGNSSTSKSAAIATRPSLVHQPENISGIKIRNTPPSKGIRDSIELRRTNTPRKRLGETGSPSRENVTPKPTAKVGSKTKGKLGVPGNNNNNNTPGPVTMTPSPLSTISNRDRTPRARPPPPHSHAGAGKMASPLFKPKTVKDVVSDRENKENISPHIGKGRKI